MPGSASTTKSDGVWILERQTENGVTFHKRWTDADGKWRSETSRATTKKQAEREAGLGGDFRYVGMVADGFLGAGRCWDFNKLRKALELNPHGVPTLV